MQNDSCLEILFIYRNVTRVQPDGSLVKSSPLLQRDPLQMSCAHQSPRLTHINCSCISWQYVCVYKLNLDTGCVQPSSLSKCLEFRSVWGCYMLNLWETTWSLQLFAVSRWMQRNSVQSPGNHWCFLVTRRFPFLSTVTEETKSNDLDASEVHCITKISPTWFPQMS